LAALLDQAQEIERPQSAVQQQDRRQAVQPGTGDEGDVLGDYRASVTAV
jgi:hypothetical protein